MKSISIDGFSLKELLSIFNSEVESDDFYDCIAQEIVRLNERLLTEKFEDFSVKQKRGVIFGLSYYKERSIDSDYFIKSISLKESEDHLVRSDSIRALISFNINVSWEEFEISLDHDSEYIRASVLLLASHLQSDVNLIFRKAIKDESPIVRETIVDEIGDREYKSLIELVRLCVNDENENVRKAARYVLDKS